MQSKLALYSRTEIERKKLMSFAKEHIIIFCANSPPSEYVYSANYKSEMCRSIVVKGVFRVQLYRCIDAF